MMSSRKAIASIHDGNVSPALVAAAAADERAGEKAEETARPQFFARSFYFLCFGRIAYFVIHKIGGAALAGLSARKRA
ncbi:hypothetical protein NKJ59_24250 [Mesorhizobium australicum]|uniref:hypothetical protein n=1 Tax=Mesorhizobium australicum TaxID=536018 RepID=UPI00333C6714